MNRKYIFSCQLLTSIRSAANRFARSALLILLMGISMLSGAVKASAELAQSNTQPNIVIIFADDWGWGDLSCHGNTWLKTPNIDRLASEGIDFDQFNVLNPVCSPSRTALMTGLYPGRFCIDQHFAAPEQNRQRNMPDWLDPKAQTLPRLLKKAGYATGHFGKWHLTNSETYGAPTPDAYGYDEAKVFNGGAEWPAAKVDETANDTVSFIKSHQGKRFFVNVWLHESHTPHVPSRESMDQWASLDEQKQVYAAVISDGDKAVGKILDALRDAGVEQNTIVLFSSDNGPESTAETKKPLSNDAHAKIIGFDTYYSVGETNGLRGRKRSLYEGGIRVPFIVRWPGHAPAGKVNRETVFTAVDILPSLCAAAGVPGDKHQQVDGENLLAALQGSNLSRTRPVFWKWTGKGNHKDFWPRLSIRDGNWKLLLTEDGKQAELYKLPEDRAESVDVAKNHPDIVARLSALAIAWNSTLPAKPDPLCISTAKTNREPAKSNPNSSKVTPEQRARAMERWDSNKDSILSLDEYRAGLPGQTNIEQRFRNFDKNSDNNLTREEFVGSK
ncbi:MAG: sulfatase-like hydrolase/transferase [Planctomycetota bacterium]|nr:sulfatase-like hydrolase/transferase [Planctomycetota bacterium]